MEQRSQPPIPREFAVYDVAMCIIFSIITCGIYALVWAHHRFRIVNAWLGREEYNFWKWFGLSIITCGIYNLYIEYKFAGSIQEIQRNNGFALSENLPMMAILLGLFGLSIVTHSIEQAEINRWYAVPEGQVPPEFMPPQQ